MTSEEISLTLQELFGSNIQTQTPGLWQVETPQLRLLALLSDDGSWLRLLLPIAPAHEAEPFLEQLLEANFDETQETRYGLHQGVLWTIFHHSRESLTKEDFLTAISRLISLHQKGLSDCFSKFAEDRIRQIIQAAKRQGQSFESTMQTLERFYEEGLMGDMAQGAQSREAVLGSWRSQLERLWPQVNP